MVKIPFDLNKINPANHRSTYGSGPRPTKHAKLICTLAMISALIGIILGLITLNPLWIVLFLTPAVIYQIYRTQGVSTKWASWMMLFILIGQTILVLFKVNYNFAEFLGQESIFVGGQNVPLGDIKTLGPVLLAVVSSILMIRTAGIYTKWLAAIIFVTSFALIYVVNPEIFTELLGSAVRQVLQQL
jgi:hypothetical protein